MALSRTRLSSIGANGFKMLLLSLLLTAGSGGLSLLAAQWHVWRVARRATHAPERCQQLLVLGMQLEDGACGSEYIQRLERGRALLEAGHGETLYLLGGVTGGAAQSEAAAGCNYLQAQGCGAERIVLEERSRHTLENLQQLRDMLGSELDCTIISSRTHLARVAAMAHGMGLPHRLCAAEPSLPITLHSAKRICIEGFLLQWYYTGYYWSRLVRDHDSIRRIS